MYIYLTEQNVQVFDWTKCTYIWLNKMYMYLTEQNIHVFYGRQNVHVFDYKQNVHVFDCKQNVHVFDSTKCTSMWLNKMYMYYQ